MPRCRITCARRWVGFYTEYDGNILNVAPNVNSRVNGYKRWGLRGTIVADLSPDCEADGDRRLPQGQ